MPSMLRSAFCMHYSAHIYGWASHVGCQVARPVDCHGAAPLWLWGSGKNSKGGMMSNWGCVLVTWGCVFGQHHSALRILARARSWAKYCNLVRYRHAEVPRCYSNIVFGCRKRSGVASSMTISRRGPFVATVTFFSPSKVWILKQAKSQRADSDHNAQMCVWRRPR